MKQFLGHIIVLASITFFLGYYALPWWSFAPFAVLTGVIFAGHGFSKFMAAVIAVGGVWAGYAYYIQTQEVGALVPKVAQLFDILTGGNPTILTVLTAGIGAFIGGLSAITGHSFRQIFYAPKRNDNILRRR